MKTFAAVMLAVVSLSTTIEVSAADVSGTSRLIAQSNSDLMNELCCGNATARITTKGAGTPCYFSTDNMESAEKAASQNDTYGFAEATTGKSVTLIAGEHLRFLENKAGGFFSNPGGAVKIRIESGADAGVGCWLPGYLENVVKDIHEEQ